MLSWTEAPHVLFLGSIAPIGHTPKQAWRGTREHL